MLLPVSLFTWYVYLDTISSSEYVTSGLCTTNGLSLKVVEVIVSCSWGAAVAADEAFILLPQRCKSWGQLARELRGRFGCWVAGNALDSWWQYGCLEEVGEVLKWAECCEEGREREQVWWAVTKRIKLWIDRRGIRDKALLGASYHDFVFCGAPSVQTFVYVYTNKSAAPVWGCVCCCGSIGMHPHRYFATGVYMAIQSFAFRGAALKG